MIRSPQAFLASLSLHVLIGAMILFVVAPKIVSPEAGEMKRCRITLSHVVPVAPELMRHHTQAPSHKKMPRVETPVVKPVNMPKAVSKPVPATKVVKPVAPATQAVPEIQEAATAEPAAEEAVTRDARTDDAVVPENAATEEEVLAVETIDAAPPRQNSESYLQEHLAIIVRLLQENLYYPKLARKRHIEGEVLAAFTLQTDGTIQDVTVKKHARDVLDRAAVRTIESLSGQLPHPQTELTLEVPIRFVLK